MKVRVSFNSTIFFSIVLAVLSLVFAGCKSKPRIDWNQRVGTYTYDEAVTEFGPPDKSAQLNDGKTVAEWVKRNSGGGFGFGLGTGYVGGGTGVGVGAGTTTGRNDKFLRLTFGADRKLISWSKNY